MRRNLALLVSVILAPPMGALQAQQAPAGANLSRPSVFFDCDGPRCNEHEYFRTEIDWVDWVRDRRDAQVHVIVTSERTGSGGRSYRLDFIGLEGRAGVDDVAHLRDPLVPPTSLPRRSRADHARHARHDAAQEWRQAGRDGRL